MEANILSVFRFKGKMICADCFNALPPEQRNGRGARNIGWASGDEKEETCHKCKRKGLVSPDEGENARS